MIEELIPATASAAHTSSDYESAVHALFPEEAALVERAVPKRRREDAGVRMCARRAMSALGAPAAAPLVSGHRGAPRWPGGLVGSMTHCAGYRAAVVGRVRDYRGLGIDAESNEPLDGGLLESVSLPQERVRVRELTMDTPQVHWDRLLFSIKEAVFKVWYPLTGRELDFGEADIRIGPGAGTLTTQISVPADGPDGDQLKALRGGRLCRDGLAVTAVALRCTGPAAEAPPPPVPTTESRHEL
ncbi:4'-phosphopantetheinyl transferase family protein [Streptomyces parvus]|uniref:4'-phosphopantetheinyl transferase family protein n=1 Tax=Streptomyces parvus TaxID=66428 RepID=UPI003F4D3854